MRFQKALPNKKGVIPTIAALYLEGKMQVGLSNDGDLAIYPTDPQQANAFVDSILSQQKGHLIILVPTEATEYVTARFLGKVAIEVLAQRFIDTPNGISEIVDKSELDPLRDYVRRGDRNRRVWPFNKRQIHPENAVFFEDNYGHYEVLHEYNLLYTEKQELFLVLSLWGIEYALNMGEPDISGYHTWLAQHDNRSPLYP